MCGDAHQACECIHSQTTALVVSKVVDYKYEEGVVYGVSGACVQLGKMRRHTNIRSFHHKHFVLVMVIPWMSDCLFFFDIVVLTFLPSGYLY